MERFPERLPVMKEMIALFGLFFRIGMISIGGGYVMLPLLRRELVESRGWMDDRELLDCYAIGQVTPGIIAVNTATFAGYKRKGIAGALFATAGMVTPSLLIILLIAAFIPMMQTNPLFQKAFTGIRVVAAVLLLNALIPMIRKGCSSGTDRLLTGGAFLAVTLFGGSPIPVLLAALTAGLCKPLARRIKK